MILCTEEEFPVFPSIYRLSAVPTHITQHTTQHTTYHTPHLAFIILSSPYFVRTSHSHLLRHWYILLTFDCFLITIPSLLPFFLTLLTTFTSTHIDLVFRSTNNLTSVGFRRETATLIFLVI